MARWRPKPTFGLDGKNLPRPPIFGVFRRPQEHFGQRTPLEPLFRTALDAKALSNAAATNDVTVALTGQSVSTAGGSLTPANSIGLSGQSGSVAQGTIGLGADLSGLSATASGGSLTPSDTVALSGLAATGQQGTLTPTDSLGLTGQAATGQQGSLSPSAVIGLSGQSGTGQAGTATPNLSIALTGQSMTASGGTLTVQTGSDVTVALSGLSAAASGGTLTASTEGLAFDAGWIPGPNPKAAKHRDERDADRRELRECLERAFGLIEEAEEPPAEAVAEVRQIEAQVERPAAVQPFIDYDALLGDVMRVERMLEIHVAMEAQRRQDEEDEDAMSLMML